MYVSTYICTQLMYPFNKKIIIFNSTQLGPKCYKFGKVLAVDKWRMPNQ